MGTSQLHYLFDLDGTLTDSHAGLALCFGYAFSELGFSGEGSGDMNKFMGMTLPDVFRFFEPDISGKKIERGIEAFRYKYERDGIKENILYPGVVEMLSTIQSLGSKSTVVTSKPQIYADPVVEALKIRGLLAGVVGANLEESDTKTILIKKTVAQSSYNNRETMMLGDRGLDIIGALENDVQTVGALWGYGDKNELKNAGCTKFSVSAADFTARFVKSFCGTSVDNVIVAAV